MQIIIPMAGTGDRFVKAGYTDPKPLIPVCGKRIIEYVLDMFDVNNDDITFICNETHLKTTGIASILKTLAPKSTIVSIPNHKKGPVFTLLDANIMSLIDDDKEIIICYCDGPYLWDYTQFKQWVKDNHSEGCILSHTGFHPHRLASTYMAYMKNTNEIVHEIQEKRPYTNNHIQEHASTGVYYFAKGSYVKKYFPMLIEKNINYNGEYYVTLVFNLMIADNLKVTCYPTDNTLALGTPGEVRNFEAWQTIITGSQVKNEEDLIKCYRYWINYNNSPLQKREQNL